MQFMIVLTWIISIYVYNVEAVDESEAIPTNLNHDKEIIKRSDGIMQELVNLLVNEKFHRRETKKMINGMVRQNAKILKQFAGFSKELKYVKRKIFKKATKLGKIAEISSELKLLKKEFGFANMEQEKTKKKINKIQNDMRDLNSTKPLQVLNKTTILLSKQLETHVNTINYNIIKLKKSIDIKNGAVYIRWGRTRCPSRDTKLVYSGYAAGAHYQHHAGTDTQCLPKNPNWRKYHDANNHGAYIYGAEYEVGSYSVGEALHTKYQNYEVPCAVCQSQKRFNVHMIPAKDRCFNGWHLEYKGYLMTQHYRHAASNYACIDANPEIIGSKTDQNGRLFYPVEGICGPLPCPPYVNYRELTCAVCTF